MEHRVKWLIAFLVQNAHETDQDTKFMNEVLKQLMALKGRKTIAIAGCISTTKLTRTLTGFLDQPVKGKGPLYTFVVRLDLEGRKPQLKLLRELEPKEGDITKTENVINIFRLIQNECPAERVILNTWDHGSGYTIFAPLAASSRRKVLGVNPDPQKKAVISHPEHFSPAHRLFRKEDLLREAPRLRLGHKKFRQLLDDHVRFLTPPRGLTMDNLRKAIAETFGRVDVIFMRNCFMQIFDTGFVLHEVADYLVACESLMYFAAYDYSIFLGALERSNGQMSNEEVAKAAIAGFTGHKGSFSEKTDTALFGNNLKLYPELNQCIGRMTKVLIEYARDHKSDLKRLRNTMTDITKKDFPSGGVQLVDARLWFQKAGGLLAGNEEYWEALREFLGLHQRMVGDRFYVGKMLGNGGYGESGFSLYFPGSFRNIEKYRSFYELYYALHTPYHSAFTRHSNWDEFIAFLFLDIKPPKK